MDYHPVSLKAFRSKRFTLSNVCARTCERDSGWVGWWETPSV